MGMEMEGMVCQNLFPHIAKPNPQTSMHNTSSNSQTQYGPCH